MSLFGKFAPIHQEIGRLNYSIRIEVVDFKNRL